MWKQTILLLSLIGAVNLTDVTFYEVLGVAKQASTQEIRQAYKKLAIKYHPDKNPGSLEQEKFLKVTEAYETLKDPDKRHKYDTYGSYPSYTRKYDHRTQSEYNNLFYNGLYYEDPYVDTLSGGGFYNYLQEGFHFINFYSPFCPPCQNLADTWKKLAEVYKGIVKVGAVNCKYYNSFCYNSMRIGSYPSLLFYPNGKNGNYIYYRGDRSFDALEEFLLRYIKNQVQIPVVSHIKSTEQPIAYVLRANLIESNALTRIAYHLKGLVTLARVEDEAIIDQLTGDEAVNIVFKYKDITNLITGTDEKEIVKEIVGALPEVQVIGPEEFKEIRTKLRSGHETPWVLYFTNKEDSEKLKLYQMRISHPALRFGSIDCDKHLELCVSLQVEDAPAWAVLKSGGAYQRVWGEPTANVPLAVKAKRLHSLSSVELQRIFNGEAGPWVLLVAPYKLSWEHLLLPFTKASLQFEEDDDISVSVPLPSSIELTEQQVLEVMGDSSRAKIWLIAFMPAHCGRLCETLMREWRIVAKKLGALDNVKVGALQCKPTPSGFCTNIRAPTARLYPVAASHHYTVNLQQLSQAPYMLEWALEYIDDSIQKLIWQTFNKHVAAEELNPVSGKKPWLVYFHSPRCYRCYEMYADFAIAGMLLNNAVHLGRVNCVNDRGLCQHEQIMSYPTLRLYLGRNQHHSLSSSVPIPVRDHQSMLTEIKSHIRMYDENLIEDIQQVKRQMRDEF